MALVFQKASVLCYRLYDVADEIQLEHANRLLAADTRRLKLSREGSQYLELPNPPLTVRVGKRTLTLRDGPVEVESWARLYDHGAITIVFEVPISPGTTLEQVVVLADELYDSEAVEAFTLEGVENLRRALAPAMEAPHLWDQNESYTVIFAEKLEGDPTAPQILERADLARLLLGEVGSRPLSVRERRAVTEHSFSYTEEDLVVVDWNAAFVYEPSGSRDIPDILEICNAQLLEFRYYDDLLDEHVGHIYDQMQLKRQRQWFRLFRSPYRALERRTLATLMEMSEFIERAENSLKIIGDFYLAKVYEASVKRLRVPAWQASVTRKHGLLERAYNLMKGEVDTDRALTLEAAIVFLIVFEIFLAFFNVLS